MTQAADRDLARRALATLDLTSLNDDDTDEVVRKLCARAVTPFGAVAAVCVWPRFARAARRALDKTGVRLACVANFPAGGGDAEAAVADARAALDAGADEIDVVLPARAFLAGDDAAARQLLDAVRAASGGATLKVILETGLLVDRGRIAGASRLALAAGADFLKTSTGKLQPGATPEAAETMLRTIRSHVDGGGRPAGFKASGGVRTLAEARLYLEIADRVMGGAWATPATFRIGASGLLDDLLRHLGGGAAPTAKDGY